MSYKNIYLALFLLLLSLIMLYMTCPDALAQAIAKHSKPALELIKVRPFFREKKLTVLGQIMAHDAVVIKAPHSGVIHTIFHNSNDWVSRGSVLFQYLSPVYKEKVKIDLINIRYQEDKLSRVKKLYAKRLISEEYYQTIKYALLLAQARYHLDQAYLIKETIQAPFKGRLGLIMLQSGQYVAQGEPLVELIKPDRYQVKFKLSVDNCQNLNKTKKLMIKNLFGSAQMLSAHLIGHSLSVKSGLCTVLATIQHPNHSLYQHVNVLVELYLKENHTDIVIPKAAIRYGIDGAYVYLLKNNEAVKQAILYKTYDHKHVLIKNGLRNHDVIILNETFLPDTKKFYLNDWIVHYVQT